MRTSALDIDRVRRNFVVGVVPFRMTGVARRPVPDLPGISAFSEINVPQRVEVR